MESHISLESELLPVSACLRRAADGAEYPLPVGVERIIGRSSQAAISFPNDAQVSTEHARVVFDSHGVQIKDLGSSNGTFVNGIPITSANLVDGDLVRVGTTQLQLSVKESVRTATSRQVPETTQRSEGFSSTSKAPVPTGSPNQPDFPVDVPIRGSTDLAGDTRDFPAPTNELRETSPDSLPYFDLHDFGSDAQEAPATDEEAATYSADWETASDAGATAQDSWPTSSPAVESESPPVVAERNSTGLRITGTFAGEPIDYQAFPCGSGLYLYRGASPRFDPLDVALRLAQATRGWIFNGREIERWLTEHRESGLLSPPCLPALADDASWMLPFSDSWGTNATWLVYARAELADVIQSFSALRLSTGSGAPVVPSLTPTSLADFLANHATTAVHRFFNPLDAILIEVHAGERWAIFGRKDLDASLRELRFYPRQQW